VQEPRAFLENLKLDLYPEDVYVFTPKGDVYSFPRGATPLDFAYRIHTDLGHRCTGARINGKLEPLRTQLRNGDIVEVQTSPGGHPSRDWLTIVQTSRARAKIRQWLNTQQKQQAEEIGRRLLEQELKKVRLQPKVALRSAEMKEILAADGLQRVEDLYSRIGFGKSPVKSVVRRLAGPEALEKAKEEPSRLRKAMGKLLSIDGAAIRVRGEGDLLASIAQCCTPVPGEPIVGFVTRGRGISVHSEDCANVRNLLYHPEREIDVEWADAPNTVYPVVLRVETEDQPGVLARLTEAIAKQDANIRNLEARNIGVGRAGIELVVEVRDQRQLARLRETIESLPHVIQVIRQRGSGRGRRSAPGAPGVRSAS
jgi:GTP pyrophosphokinase